MGMVVIMLQGVPTSLRGELTRWIVEPQVGVFVGTLPAMVRGRLWDRCCQRLRAGGVMQTGNTNGEQ